MHANSISRKTRAILSYVFRKLPQVARTVRISISTKNFRDIFSHGSPESLLDNTLQYAQLRAAGSLNETCSSTLIRRQYVEMGSIMLALRKERGRRTWKCRKCGRGRCRGQNESFGSLYVCSRTTGPGKTGEQRGQSVNRRGEAWPQEKTKRSCYWAVSAKMLNRGTWVWMADWLVGWLVPSASSLRERIDHQIRKRNTREWRVYLRMYGCTGGGNEWGACWV